MQNMIFPATSTMNKGPHRDLGCYKGRKFLEPLLHPSSALAVKQEQKKAIDDGSRPTVPTSSSSSQASSSSRQEEECRLQCLSEIVDCALETLDRHSNSSSIEESWPLPSPPSDSQQHNQHQLPRIEALGDTSDNPSLHSVLTELYACLTEVEGMVDEDANAEGVEDYSDHSCCCCDCRAIISSAKSRCWYCCDDIAAPAPAPMACCSI